MDVLVPFPAAAVKWTRRPGLPVTATVSSAPADVAGEGSLATILDLAAMAEDVYADAGSGPPGWVRVQRSRAPLAGLTGFYGASYRRGETLVVAFRGSEGFGDDAIRDWLVNDAAILSRFIPIAQVAEAQGFATNAITDAAAGGARPRHVYVVGHSLGGALAQIAAGNMAACVGVSFNAPGVRDHAFAATRAWTNADRVLNLRAVGDPVSAFGRHVGTGPLDLANPNAPTLGGTAVRVLNGIATGLFVGLQAGLPAAGAAGLAGSLALGIAGGGRELAGAAGDVAAAHKMNAVLAGLRNNPIGRRRPETVLAAT